MDSDIRLFTWIDVEEVFLREKQRNNWPEYLVDISAYWDSLSLRVRPGFSDELIGWLTKIFEPRIVTSRKGSRILLESKIKNERSLPIEIEETEEVLPDKKFKPTFSRPLIIGNQNNDGAFPKPFLNDVPPIIVFHSFKGGVGRTIHALSLARAIADSNKKVLLIDADLEAPGITWLLNSRMPEPSISYLDFLALIHSDEDQNAKNAISLTASRVKEILLDNIYILPVFRNAAQFASIDVRPENLINGAINPFIISDSVAQLGTTLGVQAVIIDLRSGLSELSAGYLLDPRLYRVFVTTLSGQSVIGTTQTLELLGKISPVRDQTDPLPSLIISQIPKEYFEDTQLFQAENDKLIKALEIFSPNLEEMNDFPIVYTPYREGLRVVKSNWDIVNESIKENSIVENISTLMSTLPFSNLKSPTTPKLGNTDQRKTREKLSEYCHKLIFAETTQVEDFLIIDPLKNLAESFSERNPNIIVIGAKGSGKTYTFLQIARRKEWSAFVNTISKKKALSSLVCPVLHSQNLSENRIVLECLHNTRNNLELIGKFTYSEMSDRIRRELKKDNDESDWRNIWLDIIAWYSGYKPDEQGSGRDFPKYLNSIGKKVVTLFDGLEDFFQDITKDEKKQVCLRALLQDVPDWLRQQPNVPLGTIVFVRQDMVNDAIRQNSRQLEARFEPYKLKWDTEEALRLFQWIWKKAEDSEFSNERKQSTQDIISDLITLWGRKLGSEKSNEARSANWIIAALSDFKGQIQARDVVRFLDSAARDSINDSYWVDRILTPLAIRKAVEFVGENKVDEIGKENPRVGEVFKKLKELEEEARKIPFDASTVKLNSDEISLLVENGVIQWQGKYYYMSEIYRLGLNFKLRVGARPKVISLAKPSAW